MINSNVRKLEDAKGVVGRGACSRAQPLRAPDTQIPRDKHSNPLVCSVHDTHCAWSGLHIQQWVQQEGPCSCMGLTAQTPPGYGTSTAAGCHQAQLVAFSWARKLSLYVVPVYFWEQARGCTASCTEPAEKGKGHDYSDAQQPQFHPHPASKKTGQAREGGIVPFPMGIHYFT